MIFCYFVAFPHNSLKNCALACYKTRNKPATLPKILLQENAKSATFPCEFVALCYTLCYTYRRLKILLICCSVSADLLSLCS